MCPISCKLDKYGVFYALWLMLLTKFVLNSTLIRCRSGTIFIDYANLIQILTAPAKKCCWLIFYSGL